MSDGKYSGRTVAIKHLKVVEGDTGRVFKVRLINLVHCVYSPLCLNQRLCREIISWKHFSHPNILPLLGVSVSINPPCFYILSEWMANGSIMQYASSNPGANRLQLVGSCFAAVSHINPQTSSLKSWPAYPTSTTSESFTGISRVYVQYFWPVSCR